MINNEKDCRDCKHCPVDWKERSQLPLCAHPCADERVIWALYAEESHCGYELKNFERRDT